MRHCNGLSIGCRAVIRTFLASLCVAFGYASPPAFAFIYYPAFGPGVSAIVAEQIVPTFTPLGLDYQFYVLNTGPNPIKGFSLYVGFPIQPLQFTTGGPSFGVAFGPVGNASVPFLTGEGNAMAWQFDEFDNRVAPGGPLTSYLVHWHRDAALITDPLFVGFYTRFDLYSTLGPVPGGGAVDPPDVGTFRLDSGDTTIEGNLADPNNQLQCGGDRQPACQDLSFPDNPNAIFASAPEPASLSLLAGGLLLIGLARRRARRSITK